LQQFQTSDRVRLSYTDQGDGPPVVLIAGFTAPAATWYFTEQALLDVGYRVIAFDRRNHGASDAPPYGQRLSRHGKDLHELFDWLSLDAAYLVGGSMGASSIWAYFDLFSYARCRGMVSVDQTPKLLNVEGWNNGFYGLTPESLGTLFAAGIPPTGRGLGMEKTMAGMAAIADATGEAAAMGDAADAATLPLLQDHAGADWRDVIIRTECPMLLVAGAESQFWPCDHATAMCQENPLVSAVVLEDCGHPVNLDQPDVFNQTLLDFLAR